MRLSKLLCYWIWLIPLACLGIPEQPIPPRLGGDVIRPAVFVMEADGGDGALAAKAIRLANAEYHRAAISRLTPQLGSDEALKLKAELSRRATANIIPAWVENVVVVCRPTEVQVAFYPRNGGWFLNSRRKLVHATVLAFTCAIDVPTWKIATKSADAVSFRNFYDNLKNHGVTTDYPTESGFESPLNSEK